MTYTVSSGALNSTQTNLYGTARLSVRAWVQTWRAARVMSIRTSCSSSTFTGATPTQPARNTSSTDCPLPPRYVRRARVRIAAATLSGNSLRQTVYINRASVHQAAKLVTALLRVAGVTAGLAESNGSLPSGLWLTSPAGWLPRTGISSGTIRSVIEYGLPFTFCNRIEHTDLDLDRHRGASRPA